MTKYVNNEYITKMLEQDKYSKEDEAEMLKVACEAMSNGLDVIDIVKLAYLSGKYGNTETGKINTLIYLMHPSQRALDSVYAISQRIITRG